MNLHQIGIHSSQWPLLRHHSYSCFSSQQMPWFIITYFHEHLITCIPNSIKSFIKPKSMLILLTTIFSRTWKKWLSHSKCWNKNNGGSFKSINTMAYRGQDIIFKGLGSRSQNLPRGHMTPHNSGPRQALTRKVHFAHMRETSSPRSLWDTEWAFLI